MKSQKGRDVVIVKPDGTRKAVRLSAPWAEGDLPAIVNIPRLSDDGIGMERYYLTGAQDERGRPIYQHPQ